MFIENRSEYQKLINLAKSGGVDVIVVMKLDRLNRDYANGETAIRLLNSYGCFVVAGDFAKPNTPADEFTRGILMLQNQYDARLVASDTMRVEINNVKSGLSAGGKPPYGYKVIEKKYYINEDEAPAIRLAFSKIIDGYSYKKTIAELTRCGFTTRKGKKFTYSTLNSMLRNDKYRGLYIYNRENGKRKKNRVLIEEFGEIRNENAIKPIVSEEDFDKVQGILNGRTETCISRQKASQPFILTGFIYCKSCGKSMSGLSQTGGRNKGKYRTYCCPNHLSKNGGTCETKPINADYLERAVKQIITDSMNEYLQGNKMDNTVFDILKSNLKNELTSITRNKNSIEDKVSSLIDRIANTNNTAMVETYENSITTEKGKLQFLNNELKKVESKIKSLETLKSSKSSLLTVEDMFSSDVESQILIKKLVKRIEVDDSTDEIDIQFNN